MEVIRFGLGLRALRRRRRLTQAQLGKRVGVSRAVIWRIERGRADRVAVRTLERVAAALDARVDLRLLWHGEGLDRLLDARHAVMVDRVVSMLVMDGWLVTTEATFNVRGERGSIDILAFHQETGSLLVIEIKSVVPDVQAMLSGLDRKARLAAEVAQARGWLATSVSPILVLPEGRTARRRIELHAAIFDTAFPARTVEIRQWMRHPTGAIRGVLFLSDARQESNRRSTSLGRRRRTR